MDLRESRESVTYNGGRHPWELARVEVVHRLLTRALAGKTPQMILDIGCGDAFFVQQLARRYPSASLVAVDIEFDEALLESLREQVSPQRISLYKTLEEAALETQQKADVVLLLDVIEHIEDDVGFLNRLRDSPLVTDQTLFAITVPAYQRLFCSHDTFLGHYRRYDNRLLSEHLARAGYHPRQIGYFFFAALVLRTLQVWRERRGGGSRRPAVGLADWQGGPLTTWAVKRLLLLDFACSRFLRRLGIRLPGLSNYALCKTSAS